MNQIIEQAILEIEKLAMEVCPSSDNYNYERYAAYGKCMSILSSLSNPQEKKDELYPEGVIAFKMHPNSMPSHSGVVINDTGLPYQDWCRNHLTGFYQSTIHTVRNNKGVEFSVNEVTEQGKIKEFIICYYEEEAREGKKHLGANMESGSHYNIDNLTKKEERKVLFTTEDGVEIFEGDDYWVYDYGELKNTSHQIHRVNKASQTHTGDGVDRKYFSTKEAAEKFLSSTTKEQVSVKEILDNLNNHTEFVHQQVKFLLKKQVTPSAEYKEIKQKINNLK